MQGSAARSERKPEMGIASIPAREPKLPASAPIGPWQCCIGDRVSPFQLVYIVVTQGQVPKTDSSPLHGRATRLETDSGELGEDLAKVWGAESRGMAEPLLETLLVGPAQVMAVVALGWAPVGEVVPKERVDQVP